MSKSLVSYISFSGVTKKVAEKLARVTNSDIKEIKSTIPYTNEDLDWTNTESRSTLEMQDETSRPEIEDIGYLSSYDIIFIGYPIWWGTFPRQINTFIEKYDLSGKTVIPFCTSGGTGISESIQDLKKNLHNSNIIDGKKLDLSSVSSFAESLNIN